MENSQISTIIKTFPPKGRNDIYEILSFVSKRSKVFLLSNPEITLTKKQYELFYNCMDRLDKEEPLAYIVGYKYFFDSKFIVNKHTLIPRPETEVLVGKALEIISSSSRKVLNILEIGTGSGCVSISILKEIAKNRTLYPTIQIMATDISDEALKVASRNSQEILGNSHEINFIKANIVPESTSTKFDLIVSNPPYITEAEYTKLDKSVKDFEPKTALVGGKDGLAIYRKIFTKLRKRTSPSSIFLYEISPKISNPLKHLVEYYHPILSIESIKDQYERERIVVIQNRNI